MKTLQNIAALLATGASICISPLNAQKSGSGAVLLAMAANAKRVVQYEWKQRITVTRKGKASEPVINQIHFDSSGQMQRTTLSAPPKEKGGIRGKVAAEVREDVKQIMELAARYNKPQQMVEAVRKAQSSPSPNAGTVLLKTNDLIQPADSMSMLVDSNTHLARHIDIKTDYEGGPMTIAQDYAPIPGGPNVMKTMAVSVPGKGLLINVDSYDYTQQTVQQR